MTQQNTKGFQPNTRASRANQSSPTANRFQVKGLENGQKQSSGGLSPGKRDRNVYFDDGFEDPDYKRTGIYQTQITDRWFDTSYEKKPTRENERNWPRSLFEKCGRDGQTNFFHSLLEGVGKKVRRIPQVAKTSGWVERLVLKEPDLLGSENESEIVPIDQAVKRLPDLIDLVFDLVISEMTRKSLETHGANPASSLRSFHPQKDGVLKMDDEFFETMPTAVQDDEQPEATSARRPCLHSEVNIENLLDWEKKLRISLGTMLNKADRALKVLASLLIRHRMEQEHAQAIKLQTFKNILESFPDRAFTTAISPNGYNLLQLAVDLIDKKSIDYNLQYKVTEALRVDDVRDLIKIECIRSKGEGLDSINPNELQAMKKSLLYGHGEAESAIIDEVYMKMVTKKSGMQLETVLDFLRFPN
ncbi:hypothetical protein N0V93_010332 [Gnomoniopsis smithogilvyi]|uniref:Uncharacterized protein n=1 Tax=Gnomoniopsis smithogilvyi TaxID=1191159 RepID=A0A9W8YL33_9PEZI|nr:hypothetical protein N0V93_010332 [Gnomoniopsis smithogilvyi]